MEVSAYYNEIDPYAAQWLRNLISAGHIAPGDVDERSIRDVSPGDLRGYTQCHFFAGLGAWSYGLRRAGWDDARHVWTGSCPCQSFSVAGKQRGKDDERHLWPEWFRLIRERRPDTVFGEQVEGAIRHGWLDDVQAQLEREAYRVGAVVLPAAGFGAPHIRSRLWFVADRVADTMPAGRAEGRTWTGRRQVAGCGELSRMADTSVSGLEGRIRSQRGRTDQRASGKGSVVGGMADAYGGRPQARREAAKAPRHGHSTIADGSADRPGPTNGFWRDADWLGCRDGKFRPVEPGAFPLASKSSARVGRLRAYGNAIVAEVAKEFVSAYLATLELRADDRKSLTDNASLVPRAGI